VRKILYVLLFIICLFSFSCGGSKYSESDAWKEKYGIEPNTGVFIGKFTIREDWKKDSMFCFITKKEGLKVFAYDTISRSNNIIIINNLKPNKYYLYANEYVLGEGYNQLSLDFVSFLDHNCMHFYFEIKSDSITYIEATTPGQEINQPDRPTILPEYIPEMFSQENQITPSDSCELKHRFEPLTQNNYLNYLKRREI
jgi:hypothetical protein